MRSSSQQVISLFSAKAKDLCRNHKLSYNNFEPLKNSKIKISDPSVFSFNYCQSSLLSSPKNVELNHCLHLRQFSSQSNKNGNCSESQELGETTLMVQDGTEMQEVPVAVLKNIIEKKSKCPKPYIDLDPTEESAFIEGFASFQTPQQVLSVLDMIPSQEVTPNVALSILRKLFELENNFGFRNEGRSWVHSAENSSIETFARMAIVSKLIDIIIIGDSSKIFLDALDILKNDQKSISAIRNGSKETYLAKKDERIEEFSKYRLKLCEQILIKTTKGELELTEVCRAICCMGHINELFPSELSKNFIDKMWVGISEKSSSIDETNIAKVFETLLFLVKSQRLVMNIIEKKLLTHWWKINSSIIHEIAILITSSSSKISKESLVDKNALSQTDLLESKSQSYKHWGTGVVSNRFLSSLSKCIHLNLHQVTEEELMSISKAFYALEFCDFTFEKTLSKFMKAKCLKIQNPALIATIMDFVKKFRIRSNSIFEGVSEYVLLHNGANLSAPQLTSIFIPFGTLDILPSGNAQKFWKIIEKELSDKFVQIPPQDMIDALLSCIYLKKYPLNFVNRIFSPYFLDRLHTCESNVHILHQIRGRLKLLDTALTLECSSKYNGPYLPRDFTSKSIFTDGRIIRMTSSLFEILPSIFHPSEFTLSSAVILPNLPLNEIYKVDILASQIFSKTSLLAIKNKDGTEAKQSHLTPNHHLQNHINLKEKSSRYYTPNENDRKFKALLIHVPEHYSYNDRNLIGLQVMRERHMKLLGFQVVSLKYELLAQLNSTPQALIEYIKTEMSKK